MKECSKCKIEKPATSEYFHRDKSRKDGLTYICKECRNEEKSHSEYMKNYREENRDYYTEYHVTYHLENPEVRRLSYQRRRDRMAQLPHTLTVEEWEETLEYFDYSCAYCGVSDDNIGKEHIIPVVKGGGYTQDNIIPACRSCNAKKHTRDLEEWYVSYEHYNKERLDKILDYVEIMEEI